MKKRTRTKYSDMSEEWKEHTREYMRNYNKTRYHECDKFRKKILIITAKTGEKNRERYLQRMREYNKKNKAYLDEVNHLKFIKKPSYEIKKIREQLRVKYNIRQQIRCEIKK